jgi:hypothetical protein
MPFDKVISNEEFERWFKIGNIIYFYFMAFLRKHISVLCDEFRNGRNRRKTCVGQILF